MHLFKTAIAHLSSWKVAIYARKKSQVTEGHGLRELLGVSIGIRNECFDDLEVLRNHISTGL